MQLKCKDNFEGSFRKNPQQELPSLELEINVKLMELFRTSTRSVSEEHGHRRAPRRKQESLIIINSSGFNLQRIKKKQLSKFSKVCVHFYTYKKSHFLTFKSKRRAEEKDEKMSFLFSTQPASSLKSRQNNLC